MSLVVLRYRGNTRSKSGRCPCWRSEADAAETQLRESERNGSFPETHNCIFFPPIYPKVSRKLCLISLKITASCFLTCEDQRGTCGWGTRPRCHTVVNHWGLQSWGNSRRGGNQEGEKITGLLLWITLFQPLKNPMVQQKYQEYHKITHFKPCNGNIVPHSV